MTEFVGYEHGDMVQWRDKEDDLAILIVYYDTYVLLNLTGSYKHQTADTNPFSLRHLGWKVVSRVQK